MGPLLGSCVLLREGWPATDAFQCFACVGGTKTLESVCSTSTAGAPMTRHDTCDSNDDIHVRFEKVWMRQTRQHNVVSKQEEGILFWRLVDPFSVAYLVLEGRPARTKGLSVKSFRLFCRVSST